MAFLVPPWALAGGHGSVGREEIGELVVAKLVSNLRPESESEPGIFLVVGFGSWGVTDSRRALRHLGSVHRSMTGRIIPVKELASVQREKVVGCLAPAIDRPSIDLIVVADLVVETPQA